MVTNTGSIASPFLIFESSISRTNAHAAHRVVIGVTARFCGGSERIEIVLAPGRPTGRVTCSTKRGEPECTALAGSAIRFAGGLRIPPCQLPHVPQGQAAGGTQQQGCVDVVEDLLALVVPV